MRQERPRGDRNMNQAGASMDRGSMRSKGRLGEAATGRTSVLGWHPELLDQQCHKLPQIISQRRESSHCGRLRVQARMRFPDPPHRPCVLGHLARPSTRTQHFYLIPRSTVPIVNNEQWRTGTAPGTASALHAPRHSSCSDAAAWVVGPALIQQPGVLVSTFQEVSPYNPPDDVTL